MLISNSSYQKFSREKLIDEILRLKSHLKKNGLGLVWVDKKEVFDNQTTNKLPILEEVKEKEIITDKNNLTHILIEGDNYHALTCLNYTHKEKIDLIYIDPPYNTGNKSWKYNNDYVEKDDIYRHSKWLSFMKRRLRLAKNLLKDDGIIVVTIDDYELFTLGMLMDDDTLFGEKNRIGILVVENNPRGRTTNKFFATCHEYYLIYAKNINEANIVNPPLTEEQARVFNLEDEISRYRLLPFRRSGGLSTPEERPNSFYPIYFNEKQNVISITELKNSTKILPIDSSGKNRVWRQTRPSLQEAIDREDIFIKKTKSGYTVLMKDRIKDGRKPKTIWINPKYDASSHGTVLIDTMFNKRKVFDYPKSLYAVIDSLAVFLHKKKKAIVLDFFAGSGTTGHALMDLNQSFPGNRQFILCTNNENNICEEVCYPRLKKAINGYNDKKGQKSKGYKNNLKYYQTKFIAKNNVIHISDEDKIELSQNAGELLSIAENTLYLKEKNNYWQIFEEKNSFTGIYFREELNKFDAFIKRMSSLEGKKVVYIFSWGNEEFDNYFEDMKDIEVKSIPQPILEIYKQIYNQK